jgi:hypothetical protein
MKKGCLLAAFCTQIPALLADMYAAVLAVGWRGYTKWFGGEDRCGIENLDFRHMVSPNA